MLEGDIKSCFDEIAHTALLDRVRHRIGDKRVLGLVKAFLSGILGEDQVVRDTVTDESAMRDFVHRDVERARNSASSQNHDILPGDERTHGTTASITAPTLVIHGSADPMFPLAHGEALADEIPGATLLPLEGAGHGVDRADWDIIARAVIAHTARAA